MVDNNGPEPTGWELLRGLENLSKEVAKVGDRVVPLDVYNADKIGNSERHGRSEARIGSLEANGIEQDKLRRSQRLTISLAIVGPILSFALGYLSQVINR